MYIQEMSPTMYSYCVTTIIGKDPIIDILLIIQEVKFGFQFYYILILILITIINRNYLYCYI